MGWLSSLFGGARRETSRGEMDEALKRLVVPELRAEGYKGSMPHLRRRQGETWDLLSFQYSKWGGAFCVEAARCRADGVDAPRGHVPAAKAKAHDLPRRYRVGPERVQSDHWYKFERDDPEAVAGRLLADLNRPALWEIVERLPKSWAEERARNGPSG